MIISLVDCKTDRIAEEFWQIHPLLRGMIFYCGWYVYEECRQRIVVTCLIRSVQENKDVGGMAKSSHLYARGGDLRIHNIPRDVRWSMMCEVKEMYGMKIHILEHGNHIHSNVNRAYADNFTKIIYP